jgi:hypothetical protein
MDFQYPINIICFNRPIYLKELLDSLKKQTVELHDEFIFFWIDGFTGSKDEYLGREDKTQEIVRLIYKNFPHSQIRISNENLGIARNYWRAELNSFDVLNATSAFFLEEDLVLSPHYFELTLKMDSFIGSDEDISHISPTGDISHVISSPDYYFQAFGHNWGYLLRGWHHFERKELLEDYISIISEQPYYLRNLKQSQILEYFYRKGVILAGTSQDAIKDGLRNYFNRISVTTNEPWASNIGELGEHFLSSTRNLNRDIASDLGKFPLNFDFKIKSELLNDGKKKTSSQVYENYLSSLDGLAAERDSILNSRTWRIAKQLRALRYKI